MIELKIIRIHIQSGLWSTTALKSCLVSVRNILFSHSSNDLSYQCLRGQDQRPQNVAKNEEEKTKAGFLQDQKREKSRAKKRRLSIETSASVSAAASAFNLFYHPGLLPFSQSNKNIRVFHRACRGLRPVPADLWWLDQRQCRHCRCSGCCTLIIIQAKK